MGRPFVMYPFRCSAPPPSEREAAPGRGEGLSLAMGRFPLGRPLWMALVKLRALSLGVVSRRLAMKNTAQTTSITSMSRDVHNSGGRGGWLNTEIAGSMRNQHTGPGSKIGR